MPNPNSVWAAQDMAGFDELYAAVEQLSLEAGAAGDSVKETGAPLVTEWGLPPAGHRTLPAPLSG
jgi:hypothetical protein